MIACIGEAYGNGREVAALVQNAEKKMYEKKEQFHLDHR